MDRDIVRKGLNIKEFFLGTRKNCLGGGRVSLRCQRLGITALQCEMKSQI